MFLILLDCSAAKLLLLSRGESVAVALALCDLRYDGGGVLLMTPLSNRLPSVGMLKWI